MTGTPEKGQTAAKAWWKRFVSDPANMWANLSEADRRGWEAVELAVAAPLEREIADLRLKLSKVRDMAESWTEIEDQWGEPTAEAEAEAEYGRQMLALLDEPDAGPAPVCPSCGQRGGPYCEPNPYAKRVSHEPAVPAAPAEDPLLTAAKAYAATRAGKDIGPAMVQRHVRVGFAKAARLCQELADAGLITGPDGKGRYAVPHVPATPGK